MHPPKTFQFLIYSRNFITSYPLAWWTDALNATNNNVNNNVSMPDAYYGWFLTSNIIGVEEYFKDNTITETFNLFPNQVLILFI